MDDDDIDIEVVYEDFAGNESAQIDALYSTFNRLFYNNRWDLFNNVVAKCIDNAQNERISALLAVAVWANKVKEKVPLYKFLIGAIRTELEKRDYTEQKIQLMLYGLE
jgi:hypothetical protein